MAQLKFYKVTKLPASGVPDSVYYLLNGASIQEFVTSDTGSFIPVASANSTIYSSQNKDSNAIAIGNAVTQDPSGTGIRLANASSTNTSCIGLSLDVINQGFAGRIISYGSLTLTDWTIVTGMINLIVKAKYYLDIVSGKLSTVPTSIIGQINQLVGVAIDIYTLEINLGYSILL